MPVNVRLLSAGSPSVALLGNAMALPSNGLATFTDLAVNRSGTDYTLLFFSDSETVATTSCPAFSVVAGPPYAMIVLVQPRNTSAGQLLFPSPAVRVLGECSPVHFHAMRRTEETSRP
jgi:hypothetical protein